MRILLLTLLVLVHALAGARADSNAVVITESLSLEQAYDRVLATDQTIQIAAQEIRKANLEPWSALTRMGPRASAEASYTRPEREIFNAGPPRTPARARTTAAAIIVEQPLIDLTVFPAFKRGKLAGESARLAHRFTVRDVLFGVTQAYYEVLKLQRVAEIARETLALAREQLTLSENRFKVGDVTKTDVLRARVSVEQADRERIESENALRLAHSVLASILNYDTEQPFLVTDPPGWTMNLPKLEDAQRAAAGQREDLQVSKLTVDQNIQDRREVIARYGPEVVARWSNEWVSPDTTSAPNDFWEAVIAVRLPIFEGGQREVDLRRTSLSIKQAKLSYENLAKSIDVEVKRAWLLVTALEQTLKAVQSEVAAAEENYKQLQNQYKAGTATSLDAQTALRDLNSSRTLLVTRTYDYQVALRGFEQVLGNFQEDRVKRSEDK